MLVATPIGNLADASARLAETLTSADIVAAEDTRRLRRLAEGLGVTITGRVVSYFEGNEERRTQEMLSALDAGATVALATDAGMPSVSDPGFRLVAAAAAAGHRISVVPGPSAVLAALAVSGQPVDRFCFEGFPPRRSGERGRRLAELAGEPRTMVFFEAPHRTPGTLAAMAEAFGADRAAAVCRELTKTYEEVRRGSLGELVGWAADGVRGEVTIVVAGAVAAPVAGYDLEGLVAEREAEGMTRRDAVAAVAAATGVRRRDVYAAVHGAGAPSRQRGRS